MLRCELAAAFFHLYLSAEADGDWRREEGERWKPWRDSRPASRPRGSCGLHHRHFPYCQAQGQAKWGDYRTKRIILDIYDALAEPIRTGRPYQTRLEPPLADARYCDSPKER